MADREKREREPGKSPGRGEEYEREENNPDRQREPGKSPGKEGDQERGGRRRDRQDEDVE